MDLSQQKMMPLDGGTDDEWDGMSFLETNPYTCSFQIAWLTFQLKLLVTWLPIPILFWLFVRCPESQVGLWSSHQSSAQQHWNYNQKIGQTVSFTQWLSSLYTTIWSFIQSLCSDFCLICKNLKHRPQTAGHRKPICGTTQIVVRGCWFLPARPINLGCVSFATEGGNLGTAVPAEEKHRYEWRLGLSMDR